VVNPLGDMAYSEADLDGSTKPLLSIGANYFMNTLNELSAPTTAATGLDNTISNYVAVPSSSAPGSGGWLGRDLTTNTAFAKKGDKLDVESYGGDLAFKWMGISLQGEYLLGQAENQRTGKLLRAQGYYAQTGYMIIPKTLEAAFRYSYLDPNRDVSNDLITEQIGAVSYYFNKHNLKVQADFGNIHTQGNQTVKGVSKPTDDMLYRVQAQIIF